MMAPLGGPLLHDYPAASALEWVESDGVGGVASSSVLGANTRKQHGLLSVEHGDLGRILLLASMQETLFHGNRCCDISTNAYCNAIHPTGFEALEYFSIDPWPTWRFRFDEFCVEKQFLLVRGEHTAVLTYQVVEGKMPLRIQLRPMLAFRGQHTVHRSPEWFPQSWRVTHEFAECRPHPDLPALYIAHPNATAETIPVWYREFLYERDRESAVHCIEDLFCPGQLELQLFPGYAQSLVISTPSPRSALLSERYIEEERARRQTLIPRGAAQDAFGRQLLKAIDAFVSETSDGQPAICAGLPWGEPDLTVGLCTLPGLLRASGRQAWARDYLAMVCATWRAGRNPEAFAPRVAPHPSIPAEGVLRLFNAVWHYWKASDSLEFVGDEALPVLKDVARWCQEHLADHRKSALLIAPTTSENPRDAGVFSLAMNALWYNALMVVAELTQAVADADHMHWQSAADKTRTAIRRTFEDLAGGIPAGLVAETGDRRETRLRASHVLAVGLPYCALSDPLPLIQRIREELATPLGLRTLAPEDPDYVGNAGDMRFLPQRWSGSVAPMWFGCYCDALRRGGIALDPKALFAPFLEEMQRRGLGHISGAFSGDVPHAPCDYVASADGLAEVLRIYTQMDAMDRM